MSSPVSLEQLCQGSPLEDIRKYTWLQYTGLKDKNGKEIYEGDLFLCHYAKDGCKEPPMEVVYHDESAGFKFKRRGICQQLAVIQNPSDHSGWRGEVIGNILIENKLIEV